MLPSTFKTLKNAYQPPFHLPFHALMKLLIYMHLMISTDSLTQQKIQNNIYWTPNGISTQSLTPAIPLLIWSCLSMSWGFETPSESPPNWYCWPNSQLWCLCWHDVFLLSWVWWWNSLASGSGEEICSRSGYHGCVFHIGATRTTVALSHWIFANVANSGHHRRLAYPQTLLQSSVKASVASAAGFGLQLKYWRSWCIRWGTLPTFLFIWANSVDELSSHNGSWLSPTPCLPLGSIPLEDPLLLGISATLCTTSTSALLMNSPAMSEFPQNDLCRPW